MADSLSWNEIRDRARKFAHDWKDETSEDAEAKTFWDEFFQVFGIRRKLVATFEEKVKNARGKYSFIDLFWSGKLLVEHKSRGKDLSKAKSQAFQYIEDLIKDGRRKEVPRYVLISDFEKFALYDLEPEETLEELGGERIAVTEFSLAELPQNAKAFAFIKGEKAVKLDPEDPANIEAAEIMGDLHDALADGGFTGHDLERYLVRILFCLFAEDTGIFEPAAFTNYIQTKTSEDGSDLGAKLARLFEVLNTPEEKRQKNLDEDLAAFPYVNGDLFAEQLRFADFNKTMRDALIEATNFRWEKISPAIFGSMFQGVMEKKERRQIGAHYTSETDILKLIRPLFLDELWEEFKAARSKPALEKLHKKLGTLRFLDPACGCGNFLVITYRELRLLELEILKKLHDPSHQYLDLKGLVRLSVEQFYGMEIEEWPARISEVALWLLDHQMNQLVATTYGGAVPTIPLKKSPHIKPCNALRENWGSFLPAAECSFILGNPPFVGSKWMKAEQSADMEFVAGKIKSYGVLDYVCAWYFKAAAYIAGTRIKCAFVSTNSITQGEQVPVLWHEIFKRGVFIHFAHRTFEWESEARGRAHVHVVIIGLANFESSERRLFNYDGGSATEERGQFNISPYLIVGDNTLVTPRSTSLCQVSPIVNGSIPADGGNLILEDNERADLVARDPASAAWIRPYLGAESFLHNIPRYCLWLKNCPAHELRAMPAVLERVEAVREMRQKSDKAATQKKAAIPSRFTEDRQPERGNYLALPRTSSETRRYIPIGFLSSEIIAANDLQIIPDATPYEFGVISSLMHMAWMSVTSGRLESRYRYSVKLTYNTFPWPSPNQRQREAIERAAEGVLEARQPQLTAGATLADLYDPIAMPADLVSAHEILDRAVDRAYRSEYFPSQRARTEFLFLRYKALTEPLTAAATPTRGRRRAGA